MNDHPGKHSFGEVVGEGKQRQGHASSYENSLLGSHACLQSENEDPKEAFEQSAKTTKKARSTPNFG